MDGEPNLPLRVEHAPQVAPGHSEVGSSFDSFQVACLQGGAFVEGGSRLDRRGQKGGGGGKG